MHHSLSEITVPESALKAFAATNQLKFKLAPQPLDHRGAGRRVLNNCLVVSEAHYHQETRPY